MSSFFDELEHEIDWAAAYAGAQEDILLEVGEGEGNELVRRLEAMYLDAEQNRGFSQLVEMMQRLGDLCCQDPSLAIQLEKSSFFDSILGPESGTTDTCIDDDCEEEACDSGTGSKGCRNKSCKKHGSHKRSAV